MVTSSNKSHTASAGQLSSEADSQVAEIQRAAEESMAVLMPSIC